MCTKPNWVSQTSKETKVGKVKQVVGETRAGTYAQHIRGVRRNRFNNSGSVLKKNCTTPLFSGTV